jgi:hypothetical protein
MRSSVQFQYVPPIDSQSSRGESKWCAAELPTLRATCSAGSFGGADLRIEMIDPDHVHVLKVLEDVSFAPRREPEMFFEQEMAGEDDTVVIAPVADLLVVRIGVLLGERPPEVVPDAGGFLA